mmetsp:Transcript_44773/g.87777  ORF Transcript_44773/g.87777 Transcript_44773/m.87777 type:complete len:154 (+) Transcript_44773:49-510(+)
MFINVSWQRVLLSLNCQHVRHSRHGPTGICPHHLTCVSGYMLSPLNALGLVPSSSIISSTLLEAHRSLIAATHTSDLLVEYLPKGRRSWLLLWQRMRSLLVLRDVETKRNDGGDEYIYSMQKETSPVQKSAPIITYGTNFCEAAKSSIHTEKS